MRKDAQALLRLHANVYALPPNAVEGPAVTLRGVELPTLVDPAGGPPKFLATMPVTFEEMQQRLAELPRCDVEPDGFFLLTGGENQTFWRLNGHMHEYALPGEGPHMHRVELNGECPAESFDDVLCTMGWPEGELVFELVMEGVTLREDTFREWASRDVRLAGVEDDPAHGATNVRAGSSSTPANPPDHPRSTPDI